MIPVAILVLFKIDQIIENKYNEGWNLIFIGFMFLITAMILFITEKLSIKTRKITLFAAIIIGIAQAIAILPGISRSGATISTGILLGINREKAAKFSFLMVVPLIFGKIIKDLLDGAVLINESQYETLLGGFLAAFITGFYACKWMISLVKQAKLKYFSIYCFLVGLFAILSQV